MRTTENKILITGAGTGMGLEAARQLTALGNEVIMVARNQKRLEAQAADLDGASTFACDIADEAQVTRLLDHLREQHPDLNVILLNAGITHTYVLFGDEDAFAHAQAEMTTNYLSTVRLTHALEPALSEHPESAMIITTSGAAFAPDVSNPTYCATKAALHSYVQSARFTLQRRDSPIKVFELMAPLVDSPFSAAVDSDLKVAPAEVITDLIRALEVDEFEVRPGISQDIYRIMLDESPERALLVVNAATNA